MTPDTAGDDDKKPEDMTPDTAGDDDKKPDMAAGPSVQRGTSSDDVFINQESDQIIVGGAGNDRFETESTFDTFSLKILPNNGLLLLGNDSTKLLYDVETLDFADLSIQMKPPVETAKSPAGATQTGDTVDQQPEAGDTDTDQVHQMPCPYQDDMMVA
jgi:hypothetical protein